MPELQIQQREIFRRFAAGVSIVAAEVDGVVMAFTVSSLLSLSLDPPLIGISIGQGTSLHSALEVTGEWAVSLLAGDQECVARRFADRLGPGAWDGVMARDDDARWVAGAAGWISARTVDRFRTGDHTLFVGAPFRFEAGVADSTLCFLRRSYRPLTG